MSEQNDDPYERHARCFLQKLQRQSKEFRSGGARVDLPIHRLEKAWPQILAAFSWVSGRRSGSAAASEICDALLACGDSDIVQLQARRRSSDVLKLADAVALSARRQDRANDAAFLYRFAGIALTQARILEITERTGANVRSLVGQLLDIVKENQSQADAELSVQVHNEVRLPRVCLRC